METLTLSDGFLVPGSLEGSITLINVTNWDAANVYVLTPPDPVTSWFYHNTIWKDMDGDGLQDCVTCGASLLASGESTGRK